ncbi:MAG: hypothetical protein HY253_05455 [Burkholderiales bacterium]|nr:hypothetical protein [Burkholderiales bacterium]
MRPSRIARVFLLVMAGLAFCSLLMLISWQGKAALLWMILCLLALLVLFFLVSRNRLGQASANLMITGSNEMMVVAVDAQLGVEKTSRLIRIENRVVWNMLLAFRAIDDEERVWQFLILFDSVSEDAFRRLKVFLRWQ